MTSKDYLINIKKLIFEYQNKNDAISTFLSCYLKSDEQAYNAFLKLYKWENCNYKNRDLGRVKYFYEKIAKLLLDDYKYYVEFNVTPLQKEYRDLTFKSSFMQRKRDYTFALLLLSEGFLNESIQSNIINSYQNSLFAIDDSAVFSMNKRKKDDVTRVQIFVPNIAVVDYDSYYHMSKKILKK